MDPSSYSLLYNWGQYRTAGSVDFYHECGAPGARPTDQASGIEVPKEGAAYIALASYQKRLPELREYAQCKLLETLEKDSLYCLSFYMSLSDSSFYWSNSFGVLFLADSVPWQPSSAPMFALKPQVVLSQELSTKTGWMKVQQLYKASGVERFMIFGNFLPDSLMHLQETGSGPPDHDYVYYYLDKLSLYKQPHFIPIAKEDTSLCPGDSVQIGTSVQEGFSYSWSSSSGEVISDSASMITVSPGTTTTYILTAYGEDHCGITFYDTITVTVKNCNATTPNVFTPNADGRNDLFLVRGVDVSTVDRCRIFNRWGVQIFEFTGNEGWDGKLASGENAPEGVYFYHALVNGGAGDIKGPLSLFR